MTHYKALKAANPTLPVLIRECEGAEPRLIARFGAPSRHCGTAAGLTRLRLCAALGREEGVSLSGLSADGVAAKLEALLKKA